MDHGRYIVKINVGKLEVDKPGNFLVYLLNLKVFEKLILWKFFDTSSAVFQRTMLSLKSEIFWVWKLEEVIYRNMQSMCNE